MTVNTKFNIGDQVWYMSDNRPNESDITGLSISINESGRPTIEYTLHFNEKIGEAYLFSSKEELIAAL